MTITHDFDNDMSEFIKELENADQPKCSIENPEECDSCGS